MPANWVPFLHTPRFEDAFSSWLAAENGASTQGPVGGNRAGITEFLEVEWLDEKYTPVTYSKTKGKPPWKIQNRAHGYKEPETEASDCESEKSNHDDSDEYDSDGNIIIREWTEAHERSYIREMMAECGMYPDGEGGWKHESF
jgi:hypothetical protein